MKKVFAIFLPLWASHFISMAAHWPEEPHAKYTHYFVASGHLWREQIFSNPTFATYSEYPETSQHPRP